MNGSLRRKPLIWLGSSRTDLRAFPEDVTRLMGHALHAAQVGTEHPDAKPLLGFGGAGVLEVVESLGGNSYRAVYTVKFVEAVYVLHAFQKKSKRGTATPMKEMDLVRKRLKQAEEAHAIWSTSRPQAGR